MRDFLHKFMSRGQTPAEFAEIERAERIFYLNYLRDGMVVIDAGANVGELTLLFSRIAGENGVHAFEAASSTFERLKAVCLAAGRNGVTINRLALAGEPGEVSLNLYPDALSEFNTQAVRPLKNYGLDCESVGSETVPATTVDEYCLEKHINNVDLLKIDVEGAELQVMKGAARMLAERKIKCLTFEFGQTTFDMGNTPAEIEDFLGGKGYMIRNIIDRDPNFPGRESVETAKYSMHVAVSH